MSFKTSVHEGKFWISYHGAALKLERFSYKDAKGEECALKLGAT